MIESLALKIAIGIKQSAPNHPSSVDVLKYGLALLLNIVFIITGSLMISMVTGKVTHVVAILISFAVLRQLTGGIHLKSGMSCMICSITLFTVVSFANFDGYYVELLTGASLLLILLFAPSGMNEQSAIPERYYPLLKLIALILVSLNFIIVSPVIAASFFIQSLTIVRGRR
ncbi:accessory gene regulator B [Paenibacillus sp. DS2015]|uniref:accessory gene regulator ArgB-like protein n=1 Tax=Paenibacillus sp. DS2015 TaxID=3373917 RepID=UPI003D216FDA